METETVRTVIGHHREPEFDLTLMDDSSNEEVSLIQHDRDQTDLVLVSYDQMEKVVAYWREHHES